MGVIRAGVILVIAASLVAASKVIPVTDLWHHASASSPVSYYVSPTGNNHATGTSPAHPWRTLARASEAKLHPGDSLLLQGGHTFQGYLRIGKSDSGTAASRVLISSYGTGSATIWSTTSGVLLFDAANVTISNLVIVGQRAMRTGTAGIQAYNDLTSARLAHLVIEGVDVSGFGYGIAIGGTHAGFRDVWVKRSALHGNLDAGLTTYGPAFNPAAPSYANADVHIWKVGAFNNRGDPTDVSKNSGSGILLASVSGAAVTMSSAYDNGGLGGAPQEGPEGIWAYDASHVVIEHDVAYDNWTKSQQDGGGFGLDQSTFDSVLEYNLSYRNHGPGYLLFGGRQSPQNGDIIRFNISYQDGLGKAVLGGVAMGGRTNNAAVYQNTVVMAKTGTQTPIKLYGTPQRDRVFNNIFVGSSAGPVVYAIHRLTASEVRLAGNDYFVPAGTWTVSWGTTQYYSRAAWRTATAEETVSGRPTGLDVLPRFVNPAPASSGGAGFVLKASSALRGAGLDLVRLFGLQPGKVNYAGRPYQAARPNVGAQ